MSLRALVLFVALAYGQCCAAYEADVHFGLTKWLAIQAGFAAWQADAIGVGDQRVDSGDMQYLYLLPSYGCLVADADAARTVRMMHYPSELAPPAPAKDRVVNPGSDTARKAVVKASQADPGQAVFRLYLMGAALHTLQDSWAHQGVPDIARPFGDSTAACDASLAWAHSVERGGWNSHDADLAYLHPDEIRAMAQATYGALQQMPQVLGGQRSARAWQQIAPALAGFISARTKSTKAAWFRAQGIDELSFLEGLSLPDGERRFDQHWSHRKLPPLRTLQSTQHHLDQGLLDAMSAFFTEWVTTKDFDALAARMAPPAASVAKDSRAMGLRANDAAELAARLRAWRVRDHGRVAGMAHALNPLSAVQRQELARLAADSGQLASYADPSEAYFPLLIRGPEPSPLLGFVLYPLDAASGAAGAARVLAMTKFRHAPYDTLEVIAERVRDRWYVDSIRAVVDH